jgi:serine/threonine protein kinase
MLLLETQPDSRYQPIARVGHGGMAEVMLVAMRSNGVTKLAVHKCLLPDLAEDPDFVEMFLDEARLCARLNHPNVIQTYEVLHHDDRLAMSMEYLEGQTLTSVLTRLAGKLDMATRLRILTSVLAALEYAHNLTDFDGTPLHVVHRDVSPQNVFVTYDGHVKLVDFGIARMLSTPHRTEPGSVRGKLAYLAPEALAGDAVDRRADLFSVGVLLWELLAGRRPWEPKTGDIDAWFLAPDATVPELPAELDIPPELRAICRRALAIDPDARYQSAAEFDAALEGIGAVASEAHARHLGQLVSLAFEPEIKQRRDLIEVRLRGALNEQGGVLERASSGEPSLDAAASGFTIVDERHADESVGALASVSPSLVPRTMKRGHGWSLTILVAGAAAAIALVSGARLGSVAAAWPMGRSWLVGTRAPWTETGATPAQAPKAAPIVAAFATPTIEPLLPREPASPRVANCEPRSHIRRPHRRDPSSDDVLDIDGSPLSPSRRSGVWPD